MDYTASLYLLSLSICTKTLWLKQGCGHITKVTWLVHACRFSVIPPGNLVHGILLCDIFPLACHCGNKWMLDKHDSYKFLRRHFINRECNTAPVSSMMCFRLPFAADSPWEFSGEAPSVKILILFTGTRSLKVCTAASLKPQSWDLTGRSSLDPFPKALTFISLRSTDSFPGH